MSRIQNFSITSLDRRIQMFELLIRIHGLGPALKHDTVQAQVKYEVRSVYLGRC
jgi:hypothetical protein